MIEKTIEYFARKAYRTILFSYKDVTHQEFLAMGEESDRFAEDLNVVALFGLMDPLKEGITESIKKVRKANLNVIMVTGDNLDTAKAIARKAGII